MIKLVFGHTTRYRGDGCEPDLVRTIHAVIPMVEKKKQVTDGSDLIRDGETIIPVVDDESE